MQRREHATELAEMRTHLGAAARATLEDQAASLLRHTANQTVSLATGVLVLDASNHTSPDRFAPEKRCTFQRVALILAASCPQR